MPTPPRRRWYQFSLRTMLIVMVLSSAAFGYWVHRSREWIRQRHEAFSNHLVIDGSGDAARPMAPGGLWLFGEAGCVMVWYYEHAKDEAGRLFPEARLVSVPAINLQAYSEN